MGNVYRVRPVAKAMQVLSCIAGAPEPMSLKAICSYVELPKTTVFRYLWTLQECGVVTHDDQRDLYSLDVRMLSMIRTGAGLRRLQAICIPQMEHLGATFQETINLGVLDGLDVVYLEIIECRSLKLRARVGGRDPSHATALGKAILAFLPPETRREVIPPRLRKTTSRTLTVVPTLLSNLELVRERGYAEEFGESEDDIACVAAPIFNASGDVVAALSLAAPVVRMPQGRVVAIATALQAAARRVGSILAIEREADFESAVR